MSSNVQLRIGPYKLSRVLGIGSFGQVKYAEHERTRHKVAIKILNRKKIRTLDMGEKVTREIANLKKLIHPHICRLYDVIYTPSDIFVVMEYIPGGELFDYIVTHRRLEEMEARHLFQQIIAAVEYCHYHKVVHRDLKPENLLLDSDKNIKVVDFGLSNIMEDGTFLKTSCGSPNYAAPEVISGNLYAGPEVDVWSCGVILYALLCGALPFDDENIANLFRRIRSGLFNLPMSLSDQARDLIPRMLQVDPMLRITIPQIKQHIWFKVALPQYLTLSPEDRDAQKEQELDDEALAKLCRYNFPGLDSPRAVATVLESRTHAAREIQVVYELIVDESKAAKRAADIAAARRQALESQAVLPTHMPPTSRAAFVHVGGTPPVGGPGGAADACLTGGGAGGGDDLKTWETFGVRTGTSALASGYGYGSGAGGAGSSSSNFKRRRWYLGIQSKKDPSHVMSEVFRALRDGGFEWQVVVPFKIRCRVCPDRSVRVVGPAEMRVRLGLQLYKVQRGIYLLDLQLLRGDPFTFMNLCARVIAELKVPAAAVTAAAAAAGGAPPPPPGVRPPPVPNSPSVRAMNAGAGGVGAAGSGARTPLQASTGSGGVTPGGGAGGSGSDVNMAGGQILLPPNMSLPDPAAR